jgi:hypothetical protein
MAKSWNVYTKLRSAIREVWRFSPVRRLALKDAIGKDGKFTCPLCSQQYDKWCADVDHVIPCGSFLSFSDAPAFLERMFSSNLRVICKGCHKNVTKEQRKKPGKKIRP